MKDIPLAIVLAAFGTTDITATKAILNIKNIVTETFPKAEVRLALTSGFVRRRWRQRAADPGFAAGHPEIPSEILNPAGPLAVLAGLADAGPRPMVLQSLHVARGQEYNDLAFLAKQLAGLRTVKSDQKPFPDLRLGEPAFGDGGPSYLGRAAEALAPLVEEARNREAALVLMGHGGEKAQAGVYAGLAAVMRRVYGPHIHIGLIEGRPGIDDILKNLKSDPETPPRLLAAPLMVVAGDHARQDLAGTGGWADRFKAEGFSTEIFPEGLGSLASFAAIYVDHIKRTIPNQRF